MRERRSRRPKSSKCLRRDMNAHIARDRGRSKKHRGRSPGWVKPHEVSTSTIGGAGERLGGVVRESAKRHHGAWRSVGACCRSGPARILCSIMCVTLTWRRARTSRANSRHVPLISSVWRLPQETLADQAADQDQPSRLIQRSLKLGCAERTFTLADLSQHGAGMRREEELPSFEEKARTSSVRLQFEEHRGPALHWGLRLTSPAPLAWLSWPSRIGRQRRRSVSALSFGPPRA